MYLRIFAVVREKVRKFMMIAKELAAKSLEVIKAPLRLIRRLSAKLADKLDCREQFNVLEGKLKSGVSKIKDGHNSILSKVEGALSHLITAGLYVGVKLFTVVDSVAHSAVHSLEKVVESLSLETVKDEPIGVKIGFVIKEIGKRIFRYFSKLWEERPILIMLYAAGIVIAVSMYSFMITAAKTYLVALIALALAPYAIHLVALI